MEWPRQPKQGAARCGMVKTTEIGAKKKGGYDNRQKRTKKRTDWTLKSQMKKEHNAALERKGERFCAEQKKLKGERKTEEIRPDRPALGRIRMGY